MKITLYDLLGMIKDGKAPKKIKGRLDMIYTFDNYENDYADEDGKLLFYNLMHFRDKCLNAEVEIIEEDKPKTLNDIRESYELPRKEDKKIEQLKLNNSDVWTGKTDTNLIVEKINEIIDKINEMEYATRYLLGEKVEEVVKETEKLLKGEK